MCHTKPLTTWINIIFSGANKLRFFVLIRRKPSLQNPLPRGFVPRDQFSIKKLSHNDQENYKQKRTKKKCLYFCINMDCMAMSPAVNVDSKNNNVVNADNNAESKDPQEGTTEIVETDSECIWYIHSSPKHIQSIRWINHSLPNR